MQSTAGLYMSSTAGYLLCHKPFSGERMTPIPLSSFVQGRGQEEAAKSLGSSQAAICKALKTGRIIFVTEGPSGSFSAIELKGFPCGGTGHKARPDPEQIVDQIGHIGQALNMAVCSSSGGAAKRFSSNCNG